MEENGRTRTSEVLSLASDAGHILLENGAEISRVEETMERISEHFGVSSENFFVLSNGIFATGDSYAHVKFIPIKGTRLDKVAAVNQLSREISAGRHTVASARARLEEIRNLPPKPVWERLLGAALGCAGFCAIFGGGLLDCAASAIAGALVNVYLIFYADIHLAKILSNFTGGILSTILCMLFHAAGFGTHLGNMVVGTLILLIPGVAFTNGLRDISNEDYLAGVTRLLDALLVFMCIALGASLTFVMHGWFAGDMIRLSGAVTDPQTASYLAQFAAAFVGTYGFSIIFNVPRKQYLPAAVTGLFGWAVYLLVFRMTTMGAVGGTFFAAFFVAIMARYMAYWFRCPSTVFLICGLFPMIPGGGVFWSTYFIVSDNLHLAFGTGFLAVKITVAIVLAVLVGANVPCPRFRNRRQNAGKRVKWK